MEKIVMYSDGGSRGNPGPAALGVYIETLEKSYGEYLGTKTNNEAEYAGIVFGLKSRRSARRKLSRRPSSAGWT
jgi:ribonuclease HI